MSDQQPELPPILFGLQGSPLNLIPSPDVIRERIIRNSSENRILRSLYHLSRHIEEQTQKPKK